jgi:hypothetical protein
MECSSTAILGPQGRVFYVSAKAVYVWTTQWIHRRNQPGSASSNAPPEIKSAVFRMPIEGDVNAAPTALKTAGSPIDQFSFLEGDDGYLNVLVRSNGAGDGMWAGEMRGDPGANALALLRTKLSDFGDGTTAAPAAAYSALPATPNRGALQNRFVGDTLIYGAGAGWRAPNAPVPNSNAYAVRFKQGTEIYQLPLVHAVDRIEQMGSNAVIVGADGRDLHFTSVRLARPLRGQ